jgi:thymidylate kinase
VSGPTEGRWFVVEGPDGAGKTSIAKTLAHTLAHRPDPRPCVLHCLDYDSIRAEYVNAPLEWTQGGLHVVQDRGALSGPVYEPLFRRDMHRLAWLEPLVEEAAAAGALCIRVTAATAVLEERVTARGDDYINPDLMQDIVDGYAAVFERWEAAGGAVVELDTTWSFPSDTEIEMAASILAAKR